MNLGTPTGSVRRRGAARGVVGIAAVLIIAAVTVGLVRWRDSGGPRYRHVVLVSLDTVRADHLGCYGDPKIKTPNLDAFAAEGVRFDQVVSAAPTTLASHTSIMTGTYPHTHGVVRNGFTVHPDNVLLAEVLGEAGFTTAAFIGAFALDSRFGMTAGFDHVDETYLEFPADPVAGQNQRRAAQVTDAAIAYLQRGIPDRLFLFVHYFDAHAPFDPPPPYDTMYPRPEGPVPDTIRESVEAGVERQQRHTIGRALGMVPTIVDGPPVELLEKASGEPVGDDLALDALYRGEISYVDQHFGRLMDYLRSAGVADDALIIVVADHGETMWEHGDFWNHGLWVYDTTVRVPLIMHVPGMERRGVVVGDIVSTIDIMPSLLALLERPVPSRVEGRSFLPALQGLGLDRGPVFSEATQPYRFRSGRPRWQNGPSAKCVRQGKWKYIYAPYLGYAELFDMESDPNERNNLLKSDLAGSLTRAAELRNSLDAWRESADPLPSTFIRDHSEEAMERLKSLGYLGGDEGE